MNLGIDFDDTLVDSMPSIRKFHNDYFGTNHSEADYQSYDFKEVWGCSFKESSNRINDYFRSFYFQNVNLIGDAKKSIDYLKSFHNLSIITARPISSKDVTLKFIDKFFPDSFSHFYFCNNFDVEGDSVSKMQVCINNNIDVLIDDSVSNVLECANGGIQCFLFNQPWNQEVKNSKFIKRVFSWRDVLKFF